MFSSLPPAQPPSFYDYPSQESLTEDELAPVFNSSLKERRSRKRFLRLLEEKEDRGEPLMEWELQALLPIKK